MNNSLDNISFQFFKLFAQYEYALKEMGFYNTKPKNIVEPDWDAFANQVGKIVFDLQDEPVQLAIEYLMSTPPKRQVIKEGKLNWDEVTNKHRTPQVLFRHIRRVRNNLYHGGKFSTHWFDPQRSYELINKSFIILNALRNMDANLNKIIPGNVV